MASRAFVPRLSSASRAFRAFPQFHSRSFQSTSRQFQEAATAAAVPVKRPVGAFRGGLFGFLLGSTLAGASVYYYILEEYKVSNELLTEDIYRARQPPLRQTLYMGHRRLLSTEYRPHLHHKRSTLIPRHQALQAAVQRIHSYVTELENKMGQMKK
ncbi:hypothetical protein CLCR_10843 [Cladophialophora carrionii]|uniref:Uncharacterized protein n=1 Tax=Cladophialophora carrionii TaxID=86049 RepID=A0A1C1CY97_9EURO|nr:hypothetical protein CLCR_10843 [Cladophialophora carrionii]